MRLTKMHYTDLALALYTSVLDCDWVRFLDRVTINSLQHSPEMILEFVPFRNEDELIIFANEYLPHAEKVSRSNFSTFSMTRYTASLPSVVGTIKVVLSCPGNDTETLAKFPSFSALRR